MKKIVLTRSTQNNAELKSYLENIGYGVFEESVIDYKILDFDITSASILAKNNISIITSPFCASVISKTINCKNLNFIAVGENTANILKLHDANILEIFPNLESLKMHIAKQRKFIYFRGSDVTEELNFSYEFIVYKTIFKNKLSNKFLKLVSNSEIEAITFFSYKTAENFLKTSKDSGIIDSIDNIKIFCLSNKIQDIFIKHNFSKTYSAIAPNLSSFKKLFEV